MESRNAYTIAAGAAISLGIITAALTYGDKPQDYDTSIAFSRTCRAFGGVPLKTLDNQHVCLPWEGDK